MVIIPIIVECDSCHARGQGELEAGQEYVVGEFSGYYSEKIQLKTGSAKLPDGWRSGKECGDHLCPKCSAESMRPVKK